MEKDIIMATVINMNRKDKYFVYDAKYDCWMHKTPLKIILNPILRLIQFWTDEPFVVYSECEKQNGTWHFLRYGFGKVKYLKSRR